MVTNAMVSNGFMDGTWDQTMRGGGGDRAGPGPYHEGGDRDHTMRGGGGTGQALTHIWATISTVGGVKWSFVLKLCCCFACGFLVFLCRVMTGTLCINVPRASILASLLLEWVVMRTGFGIFSYCIRMGWCLVVAVRCKVGCWKLAGR